MSTPGDFTLRLPGSDSPVPSPGGFASFDAGFAMPSRAASATPVPPFAGAGGASLGRELGLGQPASSSRRASMTASPGNPGAAGSAAFGPGSANAAPPSALSARDVQAAAAMAHTAAVASATEMSLRGEIKRLREENAGLRKEAGRAAQLQADVDFLRQATLLQHEEKVPIRIRELERENARLRRLLQASEERLRTAESEEHRRRLADHHAYFGSFKGPGDGTPSWGAVLLNGLDGAEGGGSGSATGGAGPGGAPRAAVGSGGASAPAAASPPPAASPAAGSTAEGKPGKVVVIHGNQGPCPSCKLKIAVAARTADTDRAAAAAETAQLRAALAAANGELDAIRQWVATVVATYQQFPGLAHAGNLGHAGPFPLGSNSGGSGGGGGGMSPRLATGAPRGAAPFLGASPGAQALAQRPVPAPRWSSELDPPESYLESRRQVTGATASSPFSFASPSRRLY